LSQRGSGGLRCTGSAPFLAMIPSRLWALCGRQRGHAGGPVHVPAHPTTLVQPTIWADRLALGQRRAEIVALEQEQVRNVVRELDAPRSSGSSAEPGTATAQPSSPRRPHRRGLASWPLRLSACTTGATVAFELKVVPSKSRHTRAVARSPIPDRARYPSHFRSGDPGALRGRMRSTSVAVSGRTLWTRLTARGRPRVHRLSAHSRARDPRTFLRLRGRWER